MAGIERLSINPPEMGDFFVICFFMDNAVDKSPKLLNAGPNSEQYLTVVDAKQSDDNLAHDEPFLFETDIAREMPKDARIVDMSKWYQDPTIDLYESGILQQDEELLLYKPKVNLSVLDESGQNIEDGDDEIIPKIYVAVKKQVK